MKTLEEVMCYELSNLNIIQELYYALFMKAFIKRCEKRLERYEKYSEKLANQK